MKRSWLVSQRLIEVNTVRSYTCAGWGARLRSRARRHAAQSLTRVCASGRLRSGGCETSWPSRRAQLGPKPRPSQSGVVPAGIGRQPGEGGQVGKAARVGPLSRRRSKHPQIPAGMNSGRNQPAPSPFASPTLRSGPSYLQTAPGDPAIGTAQGGRRGRQPAGTSQPGLRLGWRVGATWAWTSSRGGGPHPGPTPLCPPGWGGTPGMWCAASAA